MRARDLAIAIGEGTPAAHNAITDVVGVRVGDTTLIEGDSVRTGVTAIVPPETPLFAGCHRLNANGELTGLEWVRESGLLTTPIGLTNTFSVGIVRDAIAAASADEDAWRSRSSARPTASSRRTRRSSRISATVWRNVRRHGDHAVLRRGDRGHGGGDSQRPRRRRDDDRTGRQHGARSRGGPIGRGSEEA